MNRRLVERVWNPSSHAGPFDGLKTRPTLSHGSGTHIATCRSGDRRSKTPGNNRPPSGSGSFYQNPGAPRFSVEWKGEAIQRREVSPSGSQRQRREMFIEPRLPDEPSSVGAASNLVPSLTRPMPLLRSLARAGITATNISLLRSCPGLSIPPKTAKNCSFLPRNFDGQKLKPRIVSAHEIG